MDNVVVPIDGVQPNPNTTTGGVSIHAYRANETPGPRESLSLVENIHYESVSVVEDTSNTYENLPK